MESCVVFYLLLILNEPGLIEKVEIRGRRAEEERREIWVFYMYKNHQVRDSF